MTAGVRNAEVAAFVAAVRQALDDLAPDEVDDLTGGLEADLDDALSDGGVAALGDPAAYAAELRSAAGLPQRGRRAGAARDPLTRVRQGIAAGRRRLDAQPLWPPVRDFLVTLRPVWWVARAWVTYQLISGVVGIEAHFLLPFSGQRWLLLGVLCVLSVEVGRRRLAARNAWSRWAFAVGNTVAAVLLLPLFQAVQAPVVQYVGGGETVVAPPNGLWLNGREVRNVFPYDAQGNPLTDVQLYDENGKPLDVGDSARTPLQRSDATATAPSGAVISDAQVPAVDENNRAAWNVYPLRQQEIDSGVVDGSGQGQPLTAPGPAPRPVRLAPVVEPPRAAVSPPPSPRPDAFFPRTSPTPVVTSSSGSPTTTPSASASPSPSPTR